MIHSCTVITNFQKIISIAIIFLGNIRSGQVNISIALCTIIFSQNVFYHLLTKFTILLCSRLTLADLTNHLRLDFQTQPRLQKASISAEAFYRKSFPREILLSTRCQYSSKSPKMLSPPEGSRPNLVSILILVNTLFL